MICILSTSLKLEVSTPGRGFATVWNLSAETFRNVRRNW